MIIFDLEYYLPPEDREEVAYGIDPARDNHFIIGGSFILKEKPSQRKGQEYRDFWIWEYENERNMVRDMYQLVLEHEPELRKYTSLVGHGIADSDIPTLRLRWDKLEVVDYYQSFLDLKRYSIIDLASLSATLVPQPQALVVGHKRLAEYLFGTTWKTDESASVWDMYEQKDYEGIISRTQQEVKEIRNMYEKIAGYQKTRFYAKRARKKKKSRRKKSK